MIDGKKSGKTPKYDTFKAGFSPPFWIDRRNSISKKNVHLYILILAFGVLGKGVAFVATEMNVFIG